MAARLVHTQEIAQFKSAARYHLGGVMVQTQNYIISPSDSAKKPKSLVKKLLRKLGMSVNVLGGTASYTADLVTGIIKYQAELEVKIAFFTKTFNFSGPYDADPRELLSANLNAVGEQVNVNDVTFTVQSLSQSYCTVLVKVENQPMNGVGVIDTSSQYIKLSTLNVDATVSGFTVNLVLKETT